MAAAAKISGIEPFNIEKPEQWADHLTACEMQMTAHEIVSDKKKVAILLTLSGHRFLALAGSLCAPVPLKDISYEELVTRMTKHFRINDNQYKWRTAFEKRDQRPGEPAASFIAAISELARFCRFTNLNERLRDRIIIGIRDAKLQKKLFVQPDDSLEAIQTTVLLWDTENAQRTQAANAEAGASFYAPDSNSRQNSDRPFETNEIRRRNQPKTRPPAGQSTAARPSNPPNRSRCAGCGGDHVRASCRFKSAKCHLCGKIGHIASVCRSKPQAAVHEIEAIEDPTQGTPRPHSHNTSSYLPSSHLPRKINTEVLLHGVPCILEVDSGAAVTVISAATFNYIKRHSPKALFLTPTTVKLADFQQAPIPVLGKVPIQVQYGHKEKILEVLVVKGNKTDLLGLNWFSELGISMEGVKRWSGVNKKNTINIVSGARQVTNHKPQFGARNVTCRAAKISNTGDLPGLLPVQQGEINGYSAQPGQVPTTTKDSATAGNRACTPRCIEEVCKEFADVFDGTLGKYKGEPIHLKLDPKVAPIRFKPRKVPFALKNKIEKEIDRLLGLGVISQVEESEWETPIVTPLKPNGEIRICADYKSSLNLALSKKSYPVPAVSSILAALQGAAIFAKIDLSNAYLQLTVSKETAAAQTIITHKGAFQVHRLQFGISAAPSIFQEAIEKTLKGTSGSLPYFDDILIFAKTEEELASRLKEVLLRLRNAGFKAKKEKCEFGVRQIEFLGFLIDAAGIHPAPSKVKAIKDAPQPKNKTELQAFLGLLNFYHIFLPNKAHIAEPLHRLLDKNAPWIWTFRHTGSFNKLKQLLSENSAITHFDDTKPVCIACDASPYGVGAVLSHLESNGNQSPIAFYSRTLTPAERNYAQIDKEALAIVAAVRKFHDYVYGRDFIIYTDHKPLLGIFTQGKQTPQILSPRMLRWSIFLSAYSCTIVHKPGREMGHADGLSRLPLSTPQVNSIEILTLHDLPKAPLNAKDVAAAVPKDRVLSRVLIFTHHGWPHKSPGGELTPFYCRRNELSIHKGCVLWGNRVVIPSTLQPSILEELHKSHPGVVKMKAIARSYLWWPGLDKDIEQRVAGCYTCQESRAEPPSADTIKWEQSIRPWSRVHIDFAGPFQGHTFLIVVDSYSRWLEVVPVSAMTATSTILVLLGLFATHGIPDTIVSDNGPQFVSNEFQDFLRAYGIRHSAGAPFHPKTNGLAERMVRTTKDALRRLTHGSWRERLATFLLHQHATPNATTGRSPAELRWGRPIMTLLDKLHPDKLVDQTERPLPSRELEVGQFVWARNYAAGPKWVTGRIVDRSGPLSYTVNVDRGDLWKRHIDQLRPRAVEFNSKPQLVPEVVNPSPMVPTGGGGGKVAEYNSPSQQEGAAGSPRSGVTITSRRELQSPRTTPNPRSSTHPAAEPRQEGSEPEEPIQSPDGNKAGAESGPQRPISPNMDGGMAENPPAMTRRSSRAHRPPGYLADYVMG